MSKTVYVTKYALTQGILARTLLKQDPDNHYAWVKWPGGINNELMLTPDEFYFERKMAVARAEDMCMKKIASLKRQIKALEKMRFE